MLKLCMMVLICKWLREWYSARFIEHVYNLPSFREQSCNWNECIPGEISNRVLTRPIYYTTVDQPVFPSKWYTTTVTVEDNRLVNVKNATLLGLTIDSSLSFDCHVETLSKKLASRIGILSKIRALISLKQRLLLYNAIIRPVMSYADVIWSSCD